MRETKRQIYFSRMPPCVPRSPYLTLFIKHHALHELKQYYLMFYDVLTNIGVKRE
ncbi:hypothetical protein RR48_02775 [Papilio machaon]|uniref:Uncharacterized protein n=1 Tax=Papilio machaon TaxID=76193 RepID=A0A0N1PJ12_PAPMA|nr:hypothetical protein RR48_02775 [Papilio machaon]